jgi:indole-3-acetate monooxygenase
MRRVPVVRTVDAMTVQTDARPVDAATILDAVRALTPVIAARSEEIETARRLPPDLVAQIRDAGCFRMLLPRRLGGAGAGLPEHVAMVRELARADGSVGWTVLLGSSAPLIFGNLPVESFEAVFAENPDIALAGTFNPTGVATPEDGGYRVTGRWSFASGCQHADWLIAHCFVDDGRVPPLRMMMIPAADAEIIDTWYAVGMCGTGSHDFAVDGLFVADDRSFSVFEHGGLDGPLWRVPELTYSSLQIANVTVGIAEGALAEITTLASGKVPLCADATLAANPLFRNRLAEADAHLRAARALLDADIAALWAIATAGTELTPEIRARMRATAVWVVTAAASVVDTAYTFGGGSALYSRSPLQRRWRDVHTITQHFAVKPDTLTLAGAVLAGQDVDLTFL